MIVTAEFSIAGRIKSFTSYEDWVQLDVTCESFDELLSAEHFDDSSTEIVTAEIGERSKI